MFISVFCVSPPPPDTRSAASTSAIYLPFSPPVPPSLPPSPCVASPSVCLCSGRCYFLPPGDVLRVFLPLLFIISSPCVSGFTGRSIGLMLTYFFYCCFVICELHQCLYEVRLFFIFIFIHELYPYFAKSFIIAYNLFFFLSVGFSFSPVHL